MRLGAALEVRHVARLLLHAILRVGELLLLLTLALLVATLAAQRRVVGQIPGRLLGPAHDLVEDAHPAFPSSGRCPGTPASGDGNRSGPPDSVAPVTNEE